MKKYILRTAFFCLTLVLANSCFELYEPPTSKTDYGYLVVDGFLNTTDSTTITLSRTQTLASTGLPNYVVDATVQIADDHGGISTLINTFSGEYYLTPQTWDPTVTYQLRIATTDGKQYVSDFVSLVPTPNIDSITWKLEPNDVRIFVNTHDSTNRAQYYLWTYVETWEYSTPFYSYFVFDNGQILPRTDDINHCWRTQPSTQIFITNTTKLSEDIISEFPLNNIALTDARLQYKYSTLVKQRALSKDEFQYWATLQKNTENLGTLFGPQPSQLTGNIHLQTNTNEPVLGFFGATSEVEQRLFIRHDQVPNNIHYLGYDNCESILLPAASVANYAGGDLIIDGAFQGLIFLGYNIATPECVDCRFHQGVNVKPAFWGN